MSSRVAVIHRESGELNIIESSDVGPGRHRIAKPAEVLAALEEAWASDQSRVDELHRALYPQGGSMEGWPAEIMRVMDMRVRLNAIRETIRELERYGFECDGGSLAGSVPFQRLKGLAMSAPEADAGPEDQKPK